MRNKLPFWSGLTALCVFALYAAGDERLVWPSPPDPARFVFDRTVSNAENLQITRGFWGKVWDFLAGNEPKVLQAPFGLHVTESGKIYVTDSALQAVLVFDPVENTMEVWEGYGDQRFISPIDIVTDAEGLVYVSDSVAQTVAVFDQKGKFLRKIGEDVNFQRPTGLAINTTLNRLYVSDTLKGTIEVFSREGTHIKTMGHEGEKEGEFNRPTFMTTDSAGHLYVSDSMNHRIQIFDADGGFLKTFGQLGSQIGSFGSPRGIALDRDGNIYVADSLFHNIQIFDQQGRLLLAMGHFGAQNGEFSSPKDIVIDKNGTLYISDFYNMRLQLLHQLPNPETRELP